jgi:hypothetical protein
MTFVSGSPGENQYGIVGISGLRGAFPLVNKLGNRDSYQGDSKDFIDCMNWFFTFLALLMVLTFLTLPTLLTQGSPRRHKLSQDLSISRCL